MSGGGKRSAAYSYGALKGMREVGVPGAYGQRSLLSSLDAISGVSGGSFTAAYYGLYRLPPDVTDFHQFHLPCRPCSSNAKLLPVFCAWDSLQLNWAKNEEHPVELTATKKSIEFVRCNED